MNEAPYEQEIEAYLTGLQERQRAAMLSVGSGLTPEFDYVVFSVGGEELALRLDRVASVVPYRPATPVPFLPDYYHGLISLRGAVVSVIDLRKRMGGVATPGPETAIIVLDRGGWLQGMVVDGLNRVLTVREVSEIQPVSLFDESYLQGEVL